MKPHLQRIATVDEREDLLRWLCIECCERRTWEEKSEGEGRRQEKRRDRWIDWQGVQCRRGNNKCMAYCIMESYWMRPSQTNPSVDLECYLALPGLAHFSHKMSFLSNTGSPPDPSDCFCDRIIYIADFWNTPCYADDLWLEWVCVG